MSLPRNSVLPFLLTLVLLALSAAQVKAHATTLAPGGGASTQAASTHELRAHEHLDEKPPDWERAREAFRKAAEAGSPTAMSYLGWIYEEGHGVAPDGEEAAAWYARAAEAGAHEFAIKLGWMYLGGQGVEQDRATAKAWFMRAIEADHPPGRVAWASVLIADALGGRDVERVHDARELLLRALDEGQDVAALFLARLYVEGIGEHPVDDALGFHYARIAANGGHAQMQGWLAYMYFHGQGVDRDKLLAAQWANLAAAGGDRLGNDLRLVLEESLAPEQVEKARGLAVRWAIEHR